MKKLTLVMALVGLFLLIIASMAFAVAQVDFTKPVQDNSMLLLLLGGIAFVSVVGMGKMYFDRSEAKLKLMEAANKDSEMKLRDTEVAQLKVQLQVAYERINAVDSLCNSCQKNLPFTYVAKADFQKFVESHREDINSIGKRVETVIRDLKSEIRMDMEAQIERIIALLENKIR